MASDPEETEVIHVPLGGTRAQAVQRLQIGLSGLAAMVLLVGLANIILDRVKQSDAASVPEAAASVVQGSSPVVNDPLADAGVAPEMPATPTATATPPPKGGSLDSAAPAGD